MKSIQPRYLEFEVNKQSDDEVTIILKTHTDKCGGLIQSKDISVKLNLNHDIIDAFSKSIKLYPVKNSWIDSAKLIGRKVWDELEKNSDFKIMWQRSKNTAKDTNLHLIFTEFEDNLLKIPWELIVGFIDNEDKKLIKVNYPISRNLRFVKGVESEYLSHTHIDRDLDVLLIKSNCLDGIRKNSNNFENGYLPDVDKEIKTLEEYFFKRNKTVFTIDDKEKLDIAKKQKDKWDIIHYCGYGLSSSNCGEYYPYKCSDCGQKQEGTFVCVTDLLDLIELNKYKLKFIYLSFCDGGQKDLKIHHSDHLVFDEIEIMKELLIKGGVPSILGYRWKINHNTSYEFSKMFYEYFFDGRSNGDKENGKDKGSLRNALFRARNKILTKSEYQAENIWVSPILVIQEENEYKQEENEYKEEKNYMKSINWLHLSDWHYGVEGQETLWPTVRKEFFEDIKKLYKKSGPWDIILFTGDLTQKGSKKEYEEATEALDELINFIYRLDSSTSPILLPVPGNHDLVRPGSEDYAVKGIQELWHNDEEMRKDFWDNKKNRRIVDRALKNYKEWFEQWRKKYSLTWRDGILPGDFSVTIEKNGLLVGIVGLNSTFLQLTDQNYLKQLEIDPQQLSLACGKNYDKWFDQHHIAFLLTHHPPDWLHSRSISDFDVWIAPAGRFDIHFFGHRHESSSEKIEKSGSHPRFLFQGRSLFGLKTLRDGITERRHGYASGRIRLGREECIINHWPRRLYSDGLINIDKDISYKYSNNDESVSYDFKPNKKQL
ncbi:MAG: CHAT domain-containing protein [Desulfobacterales bacterium]|nr:CHAT domain-containing protein [Desulfobacterales bacterium]